MKDYKEESKRIKSELKKISDRANQICRILDKDDIDVDYINKIGQKKYIKTPNKHQHILPNLIYYQGKLTSKENTKSKKIKSKKKKNNLILNDFHSNFFKILKGAIMALTGISNGIFYAEPHVISFSFNKKLYKCTSGYNFNQYIFAVIVPYNSPDNIVIFIYK